jgi:hypothetical protein
LIIKSEKKIVDLSIRLIKPGWFDIGKNFGKAQSAIIPNKQKGLADLSDLPGLMMII